MRTGRTRISATRVAMAPAVRRTSTPRPRPNRPNTARYSPAPRTDRSAAGSLRWVCRCFCARMFCPTRNDASDAMTPVRPAAVANTAALAARMRVRCGVAARVARMEPVWYSPVMTTTPRVPMASWARKKPLRLYPAGSKPAGAVSLVLWRT